VSSDQNGVFVGRDLKGLVFFDWENLLFVSRDRDEIFSLLSVVEREQRVLPEFDSSFSVLNPKFKLKLKEKTTVQGGLSKLEGNI
jgi:hypothetical protein